MSNLPSAHDLWNSVIPSERRFEPARIQALPEAAQRYFKLAIAPGTRLASAVRLQMHGEIKLKSWFPFSAEQVIRWDRGMIWRAAIRMHGISVRGGDSFLDGHGSMRWKLFGIVPIVNAGGMDITRSAAGRVNVESIWLPSVLCDDEVSWTASDASHFHAQFTAHGEKAEIDYKIAEAGGLKTVNMPRWGNPEGAEFHYSDCGGFVDEEGTFDGYTVPTRMRVGWHFGTKRFESEGEFFRVTVDNAIYR
jgi:hypothetical protein